MFRAKGEEWTVDLFPGLFWPGSGFVLFSSLGVSVFGPLQVRFSVREAIQAIPTCHVLSSFLEICIVSWDFSTSTQEIVTDCLIHLSVRVITIAVALFNMFPQEQIETQPLEPTLDTLLCNANVHEHALAGFLNQRYQRQGTVRDDR